MMPNADGRRELPRRRNSGSPTSEKAQEAKFAENLSLLKNPSTPLPSTLQGLKNPHCRVMALMSKCLDAVMGYRLVL
jgi:hypothetical protein